MAWRACRAGAGALAADARRASKTAAVIMVAVFSIFATLSVIDFKMFGVGMAAAVLIDATIVRGILLPAAMALLGDRNWYLPRWLAWLPSLRLETAPVTPDAASTQPPQPAHTGQQP